MWEKKLLFIHIHNLLLHYSGLRVEKSYFISLNADTRDSEVKVKLEVFL